MGTGDSFVTPVLNATANYYAEASMLSSVGSAGRNNYTGNAQALPNGTGQGLRFNALANLVIDSVGVWVQADTGRIIVQLQNSGNTALSTDTFMIAGAGGSSGNRVKVYLPVNYSIPAGSNYKILALAGTTDTLGREQAVNPSFSSYTISNVFTLVSSWVNGVTNAANYYYFYNFYISAGCVNPARQQVTAIITPDPLNNLPDTTGTCNGVAAVLNSGSANTTWTPANILYTDAAATTAYTGGAVQTVYAKVTMPANVYASTTSGACTFNDSVFVDYQTGTSVAITPANAAMACGDATAVGLTSNTPVIWSMNGGNLYTDINGTIAYTGASATSVFAKANNNRNVTGAYEIGGCSFGDTAIIMVNNPASVVIADNSGAGNTDSTVVAGAATDLHNAQCELMASVTPAGGAPVSGLINGKIIMDGTVQNTATGPYVTRHFELTPMENSASATANIALYFTQAEFDAYNAYVSNNGNPAVNPLLPAGPGGSTANIWIDKFNAAGGSPGPANYSTVTVIMPTSVVWDATNNWWTVTFPTTGFSGFFLHTNIDPIPLPITWSNVAATLNRQQQAVLDWNVSEKTSNKYVVQKSLDGNRFEDIAALDSKGDGVNSYSYTEPVVLNGKAWYRIAQVGKNKETNYSRIMMLQNSILSGQVSIYPNPATQVLHVEVTRSAPYVIYDLQGKEVLKGFLQSGKNNLHVSGLPKGVYTIRIGEYVQKLVLQ